MREVSSMFPKEYTQEMAETLVIRGDSATQRADFETAVHLYDEAVLIFECTHGDEDPELIDPLLRLAHAYEQLGRTEVTDNVLARAQAIAESCFGCEALRPIEH
jgi:hypothetical protein